MSTWADQPTGEGPRGFRQSEPDPDHSRLHCPCGQTFTWSGFSEALEPWLAAHESHVRAGCSRIEGGKWCGEPILTPDVCHDHAVVNPDDPEEGPIDPRKLRAKFEWSTTRPLDARVVWRFNQHEFELDYVKYADAADVECLERIRDNFNAALDAWVKAHGGTPGMREAKPR